MAQARAEVRRAEAIARQQEMKARVAERQAQVVFAEAEIPPAVAVAFPRRPALYKTPATRSHKTAKGTPRAGESDDRRSDHPACVTKQSPSRSRGNGTRHTWLVGPIFASYGAQSTNKGEV